MSTVYTVHARNVVPGMLLSPGWEIVDVRREDIKIRIAWRDGDVGDAWRFWPDSMVHIELPGPSPRELCCTCGEWYPYAKTSDDPSVHLRGGGTPDIICPVAPRSGVHGGMRLWPAPGVYGPWEYLESHGTSVWCDEITDVHAAWLRDWDEQLAEVIEHGRPPRDYVLQCFFLPPVTPNPTGDRAAWVAERARKGYR